jgi:hypothetical protein
MLSVAIKPFMLSVVMLNAECRYAECGYAECRSAISLCFVTLNNYETFSIIKQDKSWHFMIFDSIFCKKKLIVNMCTIDLFRTCLFLYYLMKMRPNNHCVCLMKIRAI